MIMAVNDASQTARLVLDQAEKKVKPSSDDDRSCISSAHQSFTGSLSSGVDDADDDCNSSSNSDNSTTQLASRRSSRSTTNSRGGGSNKSMNSEDGGNTAGTTSPGGPPLSAFQNLPMSRRFAPSHLSPAGGIGGGVDNGTTTTATIDDFFANGGATTGGEYHVMNHFDTAVAISAALASSNLADAAGSNMGMLSSQLSSSAHNNNNSYPTTKSKGRRKSSTENELSSFVVEGGGKQSITLAVTERTKSAGFVEGRRQSITITPTERTKSAGSSGLPTLEEAKAQMLLHRDSYSLPEIDFSFATTTTDRTKLVGSSGLLPTLDEAKAQMLTNRDSYSLPEADITSFVNRHNNNDTSLSVLRASQLSQLSFDNQEVLTPSNNNDGQMIKSAVVGSNKKEDEEEGEQQLLGSTSEHSNDNESNTSSVDGVNYSSDVSPITSEGSGENNKHNNGEVVSKVGILGTLKSRRPSYGGVEDDEYSTNSERSDTRGGVIIASQKLKTQEEELTKRRIVTRDESTSKVDDFNVARVGALMNDQVVVEHSTENPPPAHRLSLFSSFDRRWDEAVEGKKNSKQLLDSGKKCFAAFVSIFITSCIDSSGRSFFADSSFRWWIDDDSLTNLEEILSIEKDTPQGIPIVVIRCLWKIAFFDSGANEDEINHILDSIQHILVKDLCYLIVNETKSTTCLYLADNVYAEYGNNILEHLSLKNQVTFWHSQFALELRRLLTDSNFIDTDCEYSL
jgi:hypothetical protein